MNTKNLFVSFWDICLGNLPEGSFSHRRLLPADAKRRIDAAREVDALLCLSDDDLLAPYRKDSLDNHRALCCVLGEHHGIDLSVRDFCSNAGNEVDPLYSINPLGCLTLTPSTALLVISCAYSLPEMGTKGKPGFEINPATVEFHLITSSSHHAQSSSPAVDSETDLLGSMRDYADEMDEIVEDAMRRRQISGWLPNCDDFAALEAVSKAIGQPISALLDEALCLLLEKERRSRPAP